MLTLEKNQIFDSLKQPIIFLTFLPPIQLEGISRELYSLIGGAPPVVQTDHGLKEKPNLGSAKVVQWFFYFLFYFSFLCHFSFLLCSSWDINEAAMKHY